MRTLSAIVAGVALLGAMPVFAKGEDWRAARAAKAEAKLAKKLEGRVAGTPVRCISLPTIRSSTVIDGKAIIYDAGNVIYVNIPANGASTLDDDDILVTNTTGSQLCDLDIVRLVDRSSHFQTGFVSLDKFVPYRKVSVASSN